MSKKVLVSGVQPTGKLHFGNYFGALKQNIDLANSHDYESYVFIADYHALTTEKDKQSLRQASLEIAAAYISCGLSDKLIFKQSSVPEHAELCVILNNVVTVPYLMRAHAFKGHEAKNKEVNVGLFVYPVLMAADILIYNADVVPVGSDQKQHIEYARDIAGFFNRAWNSETFKLPKEYIMDSVGTIPGTDGAKMSKSKGNVIPLFGTDEEVRKAVMGIVTDSAAPSDKKDPDTNNIFNIHKHFLDADEVAALRQKFENGGYGYKDAKEDLFNTIIKWREGKIDVYNELLSNPDKLEQILEENGKRVREMAQKKMSEVRKVVGLDK